MRTNITTSNFHITFHFHRCRGTACETLHSPRGRFGLASLGAVQAQASDFAQALGLGPDERAAIGLEKVEPSPATHATLS